MKTVRAVRRDSFIVSLTRRPTLVKRLVSPSHELLQSCIEINPKVFEHLRDEWKTVSLALYYFKNIHHWVSDSHVPTSLIKKSSPEEIKRLVRAKPTIARRCPQERYVWRLAIESGYPSWDLHSIPPKVWDVSLLRCYLKNQGAIPNNFPKRLWSRELVKEIVLDYPRITEGIPQKYLSDKVFLKEVLKEDTLAVYLDKLKRSDWDQELADLAYEATNFTYVPNKFKTYKLCLKAVGICAGNIKLVPQKYVDLKMQMTALMACNAFLHERRSFLKHIPLHQDEDFQIEVAKKSKASYVRIGNIHSFKGLDIIQRHIRIETWVKILEFFPETIKLIERYLQNAEIIGIFLQNASPELIKNAVDRGYINISRVGKKHAPLLVGIDHPRIKKIVLNKLKGKKKYKPIPLPPELSEVSDEEILVSMSDTEVKAYLTHKG